MLTTISDVSVLLQGRKKGRRLQSMPAYPTDDLVMLTISGIVGVL